MKGFTARSRVTVDSEHYAALEMALYKQWNAQRLRSQGTYWQARILSTAVHLEVFDWLEKRANGSRDAANYFGGTREGWEIFLGALSAMGLLQKRARRYENSLFARSYLCSGQGSFLLAEHDAWNLWTTLPDILTTGKRPKISQPFFTDRKRTERLLQSLDYDGRKIAPYLIKRLPLSRSKTFLDVGGGLGSFALAGCRQFRHLRATVVEHPRVVPFARRAVENARMTKRVQVIALNILTHPLPKGFDLVLISNVLHGQGCSENRALLKNAYRCLNRGGQIVLRDVLMKQAGRNANWGALFSVSLLLHTPNGRCYALDEVRDWLHQAGFSRIRGPFRSSPLSFDPDSILIAEKR